MRDSPEVSPVSSLIVHYNFTLVLISVLISIGGSYAALSLSDRVRAATTPMLRRLWLMGGATAMGVGIWSMHYLGMLAVELPVPVFYHWPTVLLSLLLAVGAARVALDVVSAESLSFRRLLVGGLLMAAGIGAMHYTGMAAMRSSAMEHYNPWIVTLSIVNAAAFSWLALWIAFASRSSQQDVTKIRLSASTVMGIGIASMHYIAMTGVHFTLCTMPFSTQNAVKVDALGEGVIAVVTGLIFLAALGSSTLDRRQSHDLQTANSQLLAAQSALLEIQRQLRDANALLSELSVRDGLTGLYNRRHFDDAMNTELRRAARNLKPISLLMIDVDDFKALNDVYGHQRGDDCLREIARALENHPHRGYDVVARYGGEEFALLLPDADGLTALSIAESIRHTVFELAIENAGSTVADIVTISIGVSCHHPHIGDGPDRLVGEADQALYAAKRLGRNRVELHAQLSRSASAELLGAVSRA
jgi:diguanylate cyclase (GGDEF)-like protein